LLCVEQAFTPLVYGVVVGQIQVSYAVSAQDVEPLRLASEDEPLEDGRLDFRCRAFQIAYYNLCRTENGVDPSRKEMVNSAMFYHLAHAAIQEYVAGEDDGGFVFTGAQVFCVAIARQQPGE
jgi:hypothetical protein